MRVNLIIAERVRIGGSRLVGSKVPHLLNAADMGHLHLLKIKRY